MSCTMKETRKVPDGTYTLGADMSLVDYGAKWAYGYLVGLPGGHSRHGMPIDEITLTAYAYTSDWRLFGVWTDSETDTQYIDPVVHIANLDAALSIARENGELAIWSLRDNVEIRVNRSHD